jgi:hypothetical protein
MPWHVLHAALPPVASPHLVYFGPTQLSVLGTVFNAMVAVSLNCANMHMTHVATVARPPECSLLVKHVQPKALSILTCMTCRQPCHGQSLVALQPVGQEASQKKIAFNTGQLGVCVLLCRLV